jgi:hypothetical protein
MFYNFARIHMTLKTGQAIAVGIADMLWSVEDVAPLCEAKTPAKRGVEGGGDHIMRDQRQMPPTGNTGWLAALWVVPMLFLKYFLRDRLGWSEIPAFIASLATLIAVVSAVRLYLRLRKPRCPDQISS